MPDKSNASAEAPCAEGFQPAHDIFYTPNNDSFYATKPYAELDPAKQEIRLIKIWPDSGSGLIECTLLPKTLLLDEKGQYTALSYNAGDLRNTDAILLNGTRFNVFANLRHALGEVRDFWAQTYSGRECLMWIDQICINQGDIKERSHQVRFMREIYQYAEQVLVCLSTRKVNSKGMEWLLGLAQDVPSRETDLDSDKGEIALLRYLRGSVSKREEDWNSRRDRYHWQRLRRHIWASTGNEKFIKEWLAFYDIIEAPWWNRAWVFQEFIVASKLYFMYSGEFASWDILFHVWKSFCSVHNVYLLDRTSFFIGNKDFHRNGPEYRNLCRVIERVEHGGSKVAVDTMEFMINSKIGWSGIGNLKNLLAHARYCCATDPRDKVFAFIGLADPAYRILPDYSHSIARVLTETTVSIILSDDSLDILGQAAASQQQHDRFLPSWVVDWTCKERSGRKDHPGADAFYRFTGLTRKNANASFYMLETMGGCLLALQVRGAFIEQLAFQSAPNFHSPAQHEPFYCLESPRRYDIFCNSVVQDNDEIWVLDGCGIPLILRAQQNRRYSLVSAAKLIFDGNKSLQDHLSDLMQEKYGDWQTIFII